MRLVKESTLESIRVGAVGHCRIYSCRCSLLISSYLNFKFYPGILNSKILFYFLNSYFRRIMILSISAASRF